MSHLGRATVVLALGGVLVLASASPAAAVFPFISTDLTGEAIDGVVPGGFASVDQSELPTPGTLNLRVKRVNLPAGTVLTIVMTDCLFGPVGTITLNERGRARATLTLPSGCQVGRNSSIFLKDGETTVLSGGSPWDVGR